MKISKHLQVPDIAQLLKKLTFQQLGRHKSLSSYIGKSFMFPIRRRTTDGSPHIGDAAQNLFIFVCAWEGNLKYELKKLKNVCYKTDVQRIN